MSSIAKWVDELPHLRNDERLISVLFTLGIATKEQLEIIMGWSGLKIRDCIAKIRNTVPIPEYHRKQKQLLEQAKKDPSLLTNVEYQKLEMKVIKDIAKLEKARDGWIKAIRPFGIKGVSYYTLGESGIDTARTIRREAYTKKKFKDNPKSQIDHFYGVNEVLCRLRRKGIMETDWLSGQEVTSGDLYYYWNRENAGSPMPYKPDALLQMDEDKFYIEFDTGSESNGRLRGRLYNCLKLYNQITDPHKDRLPNEIIWNVGTEKRKQRIEQIAKEVLQDFMSEHGRNIRVPTSYCFVGEDDTRFLLGEIEAVPFWG
jgi:hypothetical protein